MSRLGEIQPMPLTGERRISNGVLMLLAAGANLVFLCALLKVFMPTYEINDDMFISMFIDGQMANKSNFVLFCNYFLAVPLRWLYDLSGNAYPIYSYFQYALLFLSFTGISYILLRRCDFFVALAAAACVLGSFAADCYIYLTWTKTASMATTAGILLMFFASNRQTGGVEARAAQVFGIGLSVLSSVLRSESFAMVLALMFPMGLYELFIYLKGRQNKLKAAFSYSLPFLIMLAIAAGAYGGNELIWRQSPYREYKEFIYSVSELTDYHRSLNTYDTMPQEYDAMGLSPEICNMALNYCGFDDTDIWNTQVCRQVVEARDKQGLYPNFQELLKTYAGCWRDFTGYRFFWGFIMAGLLWLFLAKHNRYRLLVLLSQLLIFSCMYLILIYLERYMFGRVDIGLFMPVMACFLWQMDKRKVAKWRCGLCLLAALLSAPICYYQYRFYQPPWTGIENMEYTTYQIETLMEDEHLFLVGNMALNLQTCSPLEPMPQGYRDKLYFSGGWVVRHPQVMELLSGYGLENPYRDAIDNDKVYVIPNDIDELMRYIKHYYDEDAEALLIPELSNKVGIDIYRLVSRDAG